MKSVLVHDHMCINLPSGLDTRVLFVLSGAVYGRRLGVIMKVIKRVFFPGSSTSSDSGDGSSADVATGFGARWRNRKGLAQAKRECAAPCKWDTSNNSCQDDDGTIC